jgi:hypothetical protein
MRSASFFTFTLFLVLLNPMKFHALQVADEPPKSHVDSHDENGGWVAPDGKYYPKDSMQGKILRQQEEQRRAEENLQRARTGFDTSSISDRTLNRMQELDRWIVPEELAKKADVLASTETGVVTLTLSKDVQNHYSVKVRRGKSVHTTNIDLGDAADLRALNRFVLPSLDEIDGERFRLPSGVTFLEGNFPNTPSWHNWLKTVCKTCIVSSRRSANRTVQEKTFAALLGGITPRPKSMTAYSALPYETATVDSLQERLRMRIRGSKEDWIAASHRIKDALQVGNVGQNGNRLSWSIAGKEPLLKDLREGDSDVVLIFAHSDGSKIYMPGKHGSSISVTELRSVRRNSTPARAVVLIACNAGQVGQDTQSIAEAILESKLAATVFAYPSGISPSYVPEMLARLRSGASLRNALPGLYQIVVMRGKQDEVNPELRLRFGLFLQRPRRTAAGRRRARQLTDLPGSATNAALCCVGSV